MSPNIELKEEKDMDNIANQSVKASLKMIFDRPPNLLLWYITEKIIKLSH